MATSIEPAPNANAVRKHSAASTFIANSLNDTPSW